MKLCEVLAPVGGGPEDGLALARARAVADAVGARVTAVFAHADPAEALMWSAEGFYVSMPESVLDSARAGADEAWQRLETLIAAHDGVASERLVGAPETVLAQRAALTDLVVFPCVAARGKGALAGVFEAMVMEARAPVLVPRGAEADWAGGWPDAPAVVAWDGGAEAARAVRAALPLLRKASGVAIVQAAGPVAAEARRFAEPERLALYLDGHGVRADVQILDAPGRSAADLVLEAARGRGAGLIVAGAYGHSRLREFVFGGATRRFLAAADGPSLLLAH